MAYTEAHRDALKQAIASGVLSLSYDGKTVRGQIMAAWRQKWFRILSDRYRSRRKRFGLRINLISAIHNWEIDHVNDVSE